MVNRLIRRLPVSAMQEPSRYCLGARESGQESGVVWWEKLLYVTRFCSETVPDDRLAGPRRRFFNATSYSVAVIRFEWPVNSSWSAGMVLRYRGHSIFGGLPKESTGR